MRLSAKVRAMRNSAMVRHSAISCIGFPKLRQWVASRRAKSAEKLLEFRKLTNMLEDLSFDTISAAGPNAAMPHYHVPADGGRKLGMDEIFLID